MVHTFLLQEEQELARTQASSQESSVVKAPWDNPLNMALNRVKEVPVSRKRHRGRVIGAGSGRKYSDYFSEDKEVRKERRRLERDNTQREFVQEEVIKQIQTLLPSITQSVINWIDSG